MFHPEQKYAAEGMGFEPMMDCSILVFKTSALGRSATPPGRSFYHKTKLVRVHPAQVGF